MATMEIVESDAFSFLSGLDADSVAVVVTSPPYNLGSNVSKGGQDPGRKGRWADAYPGYMDMVSPEDYVHYHRTVLGEIMRVLQPDGIAWYVHCRRSDGLAAQVVRDFPVRHEIIWKKVGSGVFNLPTGGKARVPVLYPARRYETVFMLAKGKLARMDREIAKLGDVWDFVPDRVPGCPAPFPLELVRRCIAATEATGRVVDPFVGSGTTALVAREIGRDFAGCDISSAALTIARRRLTSCRQYLLKEQQHAQ